MGLAPVQPHQELLDALSLDAAWERAKDLEDEIKRLRVMLKTSKQQFEKQWARRSRLENDIRRIVTEYEPKSNQGTCETDTDLDYLLLELKQLLRAE